MDLKELRMAVVEWEASETSSTYSATEADREEERSSRGR